MIFSMSELCEIEKRRSYMVSKSIFVQFPKWIVPWWWRFAYLMPPPGGWADKLINIKPDEKFNAVVTEHVVALVQQGKEPPAAIAATITNLAEDLLAGRPMTIKTGDYIAIQTFMRKG
jgi:hypothetical protein